MTSRSAGGSQERKGRRASQQRPQHLQPAERLHADLKVAGLKVWLKAKMRGPGQAGSNRKPPRGLYRKRLFRPAVEEKSKTTVAGWVTSTLGGWQGDKSGEKSTHQQQGPQDPDPGGRTQPGVHVPMSRPPPAHSPCSSRNVQGGKDGGGRWGGAGDKHYCTLGMVVFRNTLCHLLGHKFYLSRKKCQTSPPRDGPVWSLPPGHKELP